MTLTSLMLSLLLPAAAQTAAAPDAQLREAVTAARGAALAAAQELKAGRATPIREQTTMVAVALNESTVKCSAADYQEPMLKVLIPALAQLTVLNHRNTREGAPCVAAGSCSEIGPERILKPGAGVEQVPITVKLAKRAELDGSVCRVYLDETVTTTIRGVPFFHARSHQVAQRAPEDCR